MQGAEHAGDGPLFGGDEQDVFEDDRAGFALRVEDESTRSEQEELEHVGDFLIDLHVRGAVALEVAHHAMVMEDFVRSDLPVVEAEVEVGDRVEQEQDAREREVKGRVGIGLEVLQNARQEGQDLVVEAEQQQRAEDDRHHGEHEREGGGAGKVEGEDDEIQAKYGEENRRDQFVLPGGDEAIDRRGEGGEKGGVEEDDFGGRDEVNALGRLRSGGRSRDGGHREHLGLE